MCGIAGIIDFNQIEEKEALSFFNAIDQRT